jgi:hypothetical protein
MGTLADLLAVDMENSERSWDDLKELDPSLPVSLDMAAEMFSEFPQFAESRFSELVAGDLERIRRRARELGKTGDELTEMLHCNGCNAELLGAALDPYLRNRGRAARAVIFLLLHRQYLWAATDLLRLRLTAMDGGRRLEAESIGLLLVIQNDPSVGDQWLRVVSDDHGRNFFNHTKKLVSAALRRVRLANIYANGSSIAQHVRAASVARGLSFSSTGVEISSHDGQDDPFAFFLSAVSFLSTQVDVFRALTEAFPEVTDPFWGSRVRLFTVEVAPLWKRLEERFPREWRRLQERGQGPAAPPASSPQDPIA